MPRPSLNLLLRISDDGAEKFEVPETEDRRLTIWLSHRHDMITFGYINDALVWFSFTKTDDRLSSRRIFDCNKVGAFYRKSTEANALESAGMIVENLSDMCRLDVTNILTPTPVFSGIASAVGDNMTSVDFAQYIADLPENLNNAINQLGSPDELLIALNKDCDFLDKLYGPHEGFSQSKYEQAVQICDRWKRFDYIKLSDRAGVRSLYRRVCNHKASIKPEDELLE